MSEITYRQEGDVLLPNIELSEEENIPLGKFGMLRKTYLEKHHPILYNVWLFDGTLHQQLLEVDRQAESWMEEMMPKLAKAAGATEELKAENQMKWVGLMNACQAQVEEIILAELVYS